MNLLLRRFAEPAMWQPRWQQASLPGKGEEPADLRRHRHDGGVDQMRRETREGQELLGLRSMRRELLAGVKPVQFSDGRFRRRHQRRLGQL